MDERARRIGENEALYRSVNDKIEGLNQAFGVVAESMAVVCECGRLDRTEQITLDIPMYEHVRADPTHFVILPGHEELDAFNIVPKDPGEPAEPARELA